MNKLPFMVSKLKQKQKQEAMVVQKYKQGARKNMNICDKIMLEIKLVSQKFIFVVSN